VTVAAAVGSAAVAPPSNAEGTESLPSDADLRNKDNDAIEPEAAIAAINGKSIEATDASDMDEQAEDEEDEDKDDDDEARWERYQSKLEDEQAKKHVAAVPTKLVANTRAATWPLALRASPRLPTTPRELHRSTLPRDLVMAYDWRGTVTERTGLRFPHTAAFNSKDWTISFVLKLDKASTAGGWHNIVNKGHNSKDRGPGVWLSNVNRLWVRLYTDHHYDEGFHSKATIAPGVTTHISIVRRERTFALFINGNLDSHLITLGQVVPNDGPVHISRSPGYLGFNGELYTLRWYSRALSVAELRTNAGVSSARPVLALAWKSSFNNDDLDVVNVPHDKSMESSAFSILFWITLGEDSTGTWRSVFHKGGLKALTPSCFLMPHSRRLSCHLSTTHGPDEQIVSKSIIPMHTPTHVALVRSGKALELYFDGVLDVKMVTKGYTAHNSFHLNIGTSRWVREGKTHSVGFVGKLDAFTWVDTMYNVVEVRRDMERDSPSPVLQLDARIDFRAEDRIVIPDIAPLRSQAFTVSFWLNLASHATRKHDRNRPDRDWNMIFRKGAASSQNTPSLWFRASDKASKLQIRMSTTHSFREMFDSTAKVPVGTPTRVTLVMEGKVIRLYLGDVEDSVYVMRGTPVENFGPLFIGSDPHSVGTQGQIENFRWWNRPLSHTEVMSVSPHSLFRYWTPPLVGSPAASVETGIDFNGFNMMTLPDSNLRSDKVSLMAWVTLGTNSGRMHRVLFAKGVKRGAYAPLVKLDAQNRIVISVATAHDKKRGEVKRSAHALEAGVPTHVAVVINGRDVKLFINGVLDAYTSLVQDPILNDSPWTVGKSMTHAGLVARMSQIRLYTRALLENDVHLLASGQSRRPALDFRWNGAFDGKNGVVIPHTPAIDSAEMTMALWVTVTGEPDGAFRVITTRGDSSHQRTVTIALRPNSNKLQVSVSTSRAAVETLASEHVLAKGVPTSVVFVLSNGHMSLYINGLLDSEANVQGSVVFNAGPLLLGASPWENGIVGQVSGIQVYPRAFAAGEIMEFAAAIHVPTSLQFDLSGKFSGTGLGSVMRIPHSPIFDADSYSISFWISFRSAPTSQWETIMRKGDRNTDRAPAIFRYPHSGEGSNSRLYFAVSTEKNLNAGMTPNTTVPTHEPTHIAMVVDGSTVTVFINGESEGRLVLGSPITHNKGTMFVGGDLFYETVDAQISDFRVIPGPLARADVIQAMQKSERY
jgi:hypothetical protein